METYGPLVVLYDDGTIARNAELLIVDHGTSTPATVYGSADGITPIANPVTTDSDGNLLFFNANTMCDVLVRSSRITLACNTRGPEGPTGIPPSEWYDPPDMIAIFNDALNGGV